MSEKQNAKNAKKHNAKKQKMKPDVQRLEKGRMPVRVLSLNGRVLEVVCCVNVTKEMSSST